MAIASLILGIAGMILIPVIASILAIVFGILGLNQIKKNNEKGKGMAIAGLILGIVGFVVLFILVFVGAMAYFGVLSPNKMVPDRCTLGSGFTCMSFDKTQTSLTFGIQNNLGQNAEDVIITFTPTMGACQAYQRTLDSMQNGEAFLVNTPCTLGGGTTKGDIEIMYSTPGSPVVKMATGEILVTN